MEISQNFVAFSEYMNFIFKIVMTYVSSHDMILFLLKKLRPHLSKVTKHFSKIRHTPHAILRCFDVTEKNGT